MPDIDRQSSGMQSQVQLLGTTDASHPLLRALKHDFGNILLALRQSAESLQADTAPGEDFRAELVHMLASIDEATTLFDSVSKLTAPLDDKIISVDVNRQLGACAGLLTRLMGDQRHLRIEMAPKLPPVMTPDGLIEKVLLQLLMLAHDAVPCGEGVVIRTMTGAVDDRLAGSFTGAAMPRGSGYVVVELAGPGIAIDAPDRHHAEGWRATLRRLSDNLMGAHGSLWGQAITSTSGAVRVYLRSATPDTAPPVQTPRHVDLGGHETILVAEDDDGARRAITRILRAAGYQVLEAESGAAALRMLLYHEGGIDVLLADVMMPDFDGPTLAEQMLHVRPGIKVAYASGLSREEFVRQLGWPAPGSIAFVQKPFRREELLSLMREVLEDKAST